MNGRLMLHDNMAGWAWLAASGNSYFHVFLFLFLWQQARLGGVAGQRAAGAAPAFWSVSSR